MVCELGGHRNLATYSPDDDHELMVLRLEHTRRLFCAFYVLDSDISLRTGKPSALPEEYCDVPLPGSWRESGLLYDPRICSIKKRISWMLHFPKLHTTSDGQILEGIRSLDSELEEWRQSLPPENRPKISIPPHHTLISAAEYHQRQHTIDLQFDYHYVLVVLHNIVRRCGPVEGEELPEDLHAVIHSSIDVSLEAARSTLRFLAIASDPDPRLSYQYGCPLKTIYQ